MTTKNVDAELALQAGPQLVVPITNARYALNAANARWGSLYDALYGTDVLSEDDGAEKGSGYNPKRGAKVIEYARHVLDRCVPLVKGSHLDSTAYRVVDNNLAVTLKDGRTVGLKNPAQFVGFQGETDAPSGGAAVAPRAAHGHPRRPRAPDRPRRPGRRVRPGARIGAVDHHGPRGLGRGGRRRRQGAGLRQLARHPARHAHRNRRQGRQELHPRPEPRPPVHRPARRGRGAARPLAAVRAQRRPPDEQPGRAVGRGRPRDPRGHPRRGGHHHDRAARPEGPGRRRASAIRAMARSTSSSRRCMVRPRWPSPASCSAASRRCSACPRPRSSSASWTRSAAPASTSRPASPRPPTAWPSSTPVSSTAPATRCTPPCTPGR